MGTRTKKLLLIIIPIVAIILASILTLNLITISPLAKLGEYNNVRVLNYYDNAQATNSEKDKVVVNALETVNFSMMRAIMQGSARYNIRPVEYTDSEGNQARRSYTAQAFAEISPSSGEFMLELIFDKKQTSDLFLDQDENKIIYDRLILIIPDRQDVIQDVKVYPLLSFNMDNQLSDEEPNQDGHIGSIYYKVYEFSGKMYTYKLHEMLSDKFTAGRSAAANLE